MNSDKFLYDINLEEDQDIILKAKSEYEHYCKIKLNSSVGFQNYPFVVLYSEQEGNCNLGMGVLVGLDLILTAAHNVIFRGSNDEKVLKLSAGFVIVSHRLKFNAGIINHIVKKSENDFFQVAKWKKIFYLTEYEKCLIQDDKTNVNKSDIALILIEKELGKRFGFFKVHAGINTYCELKTDQEIVMPNFNKTSGLCHLQKHNWQNNIEWSENFIEYNIDTQKGQSGAPILIKRPDQGISVEGIHLMKRSNKGVAFNLTENVWLTLFFYCERSRTSEPKKSVKVTEALLTTEFIPLKSILHEPTTPKERKNDDTEIFFDIPRNITSKLETTLFNDKSFLGIQNNYLKDFDLGNKKKTNQREMESLNPIMVLEKAQNLIHNINFKAIDNFYYDTSKPIGKGTFGTVYKAFDESNNNNQVAVKVIPATKLLESEEQYNISMREIDVLRRIKSTHMVQLIDVKRTPNNLYIFLEYCDGGDLEKLIKQKKIFSQEDALNIVKQLASAFTALEIYNEKKNQVTIMHRDIKPANILFNKGMIKIADFGFAKLIDEGDKYIKKAHCLAGDPLYSSPQILNDDLFSAKCDVWSTGVILYELLFGKLPWTGYSVANLYSNIKNKTLEIPKGKISDEAMDLVQKMLGFKEEDRLSWKDVYEHPSMKYIKISSDDYQKLMSNCCVCLENPPQMLFYPCGHHCICEDCQPKYKMMTCPLCRQNYENIIKVVESSRCSKCLVKPPQMLFYPCSHQSICEDCQPTYKTESSICPICSQKYDDIIKVFRH